MRNDHVAEPLRSIINAASPSVSDGRKCCMCFQARPAMRWIEGTWWCVPCHDQFTADMNADE